MAWSGSNFNDFKQFNSNNPVKTSKNAYRGSDQINNNSSLSQLEQLNVGSTANVIGTVIAKEDVKSIFSKKDKGSERFLMSFTMRDSPGFFVNCTCWGNENFIRDLARVFCIGDVVKIENAYVHQNSQDGNDERYRVTTPLPFHLTLSEKHSSLTLYSGLDLDSYSSLQHIPTKDNSDFYTLEDVLANDQNLNGEHINILAAVRKVGPAKDITTKTGKHTKRCEIKLFDESCHSFPMILWGEEVVNFVQTWAPYETVVFAADVRMNYDHFRNGMTATADSKTVMTVNPETLEARCLYQFAQTQNFPGEVETEYSDPPLPEIRDVKTVKDLYDIDGTSAYAVLFGVVTRFDLDADNTEQFFVRKCCKCKRLVTRENDYKCMNPECCLGALQMFNTGGQVTLEEPELDFRMTISISDHTGTISGRLTAPIMESMMGMKGRQNQAWNDLWMCDSTHHGVYGWFKVNDLFNLDVQKRTDMKWHYLLERCKFHVKMMKNMRDQDKSTLRILSCSRADSGEVHNSMVQF